MRVHGEADEMIWDCEVFMRLLAGILALVALVSLGATVWMYRTVTNERRDLEYYRNVSTIHRASRLIAKDLSAGRLRRYETTTDPQLASIVQDGDFEVVTVDISRVYGEEGLENTRKIYELYNRFLMTDVYNNPETELWRVYLLIKAARDAGQFVPDPANHP